MSYAKGDGGYRLPAIIDPERICIQLEIPNEPEHLRAFWGALWTLTWYTSWQKDSNKTAAAVASVWKDVWFKARAANVDWDACLCEDENGCIEYTPQFIQDWWPNNPYISVPDDLTPKWYIAPEINLLGVPAGTVVCDIVNSQPGEPGFPRFRMYFSGTGVVELHLHSVPLGGAAQIQLDGLLSSLRYIELNADNLSIPPDTAKPVIVEIEVDQPGQHFIDLTMIPFFNDEVTFVGFGGGLQKIVLCGFDQMIITPQFRFTPQCGLEQSNDNGATWVPVSGWDTFAPDCFTGPAGADGATGPAGPAGPAGDCECPDPATDDRDIPPPSNVADTCALARRLANHIIDLHTRWSNDIAYSLYTQGRAAQDVANDISEFLYAGTLEPYVSAVTGDEYQYDVWNVLFANALILPLIGGNFVSNVVALIQGYQALDVIALRDAVTAARDDITCAWIDALDSDLTVLQGEYDGFKSALAGRMTDASAAAQLQAFLALIPLARIRQLARTVNDVPTYDCIDCAIEYEWCLTFDFTLDRRGWVTGNFPGDPTGYTAGVGLTTWAPTNNAARVTHFTGGSWFIGGLTGITKAVTVDYVGGVRGTGAGDLLLRLSGGDWVQEFPRSGWSGSGRMTAFITPATGRPLNSIQLSCTVSDVQPAQDHLIGNLTITRVTVYGVGPVPAWDDFTEVC